MIRIIATALLLTCFAACSSAPAPALAAARLPVFDVHLHAQSNEKSAVAMRQAMRDMNVTAAVVIASDLDLPKVASWFEGAKPGLLFPCENGLMANAGVKCFQDGRSFP